MISSSTTGIAFLLLLHLHPVSLDLPNWGLQAWKGVHAPRRRDSLLRDKREASAESRPTVVGAAFEAACPERRMTTCCPWTGGGGNLLTR